MNILFLANHLNTGGITSYVFRLATGLKKRGHKIYVASSNGDCSEKFLKQDITLIKVPLRTKSEASPKIFFSLLKLLPLVKKEEVEIIHANTRVTQVLAFWLSKFSSVPYVSTCHGFFRPHFFRKAFPLWGKKVIAISDEVRKHLVNDLRVKETDIEVIYNGIDFEKSKIQNPKSKIEMKKEMNLDDGPVVGIIARLSDVKGHKYLIEAFKKVLVNLPAAQLLIIGEGKEKNNLVGLARALNITKGIKFIDTLPDIEEALSVMDVFVMPSLQEGLGLSLMEAMAKGLAVVGSDVGGIRNLISHQQNGLLVKPKDIQGLKDAILELLNEPSKRNIYGENASRFIKDNFSQEKMVKETEEFYKKCLR